MLTRREFMGATIAAGLLPTACRSTDSAAGAAPNIVIIMADDVGYEQIGYSSVRAEASTPNIDGIARNGVQLTQFYAQPVCTASRACLLTGRYSWKTGTDPRVKVWSQRGMLTDERTLAQALKETGYSTWCVGKWHLGQWKQAHLPLNRGFDHHYGQYSAKSDSFTRTRLGILDWHRNGEPILEEGYASFLLAQEAASLISRRDKERPFFLYLPFSAAHEPYQAPPEYIESAKARGADFPVQRAMVECMDIAIGTVLDSLVANGVAENTLVIFLSDNGASPRSDHSSVYRGNKGDFFEGGIRVPACMSWPGHIDPGTTCGEPVHVTALFPTLATLAQARLEQTLKLDGQDVWGTLTRGEPSPDEEIVYSLNVIRRGDFKLIAAGQYDYNWGEQDLQLYDIRRDPGETVNLASKRPDLVVELKRRLELHRHLARAPEPESRIPDFPPFIFGESENRQFGAQLASRIEEMSRSESVASVRRRDEPKAEQAP